MLNLKSGNAYVGDIADLTATAAEINIVADVDARVQELTVSGAVTAGVQSVELNHASVAVVTTIADAANHQGLFVVKDTSATGTAAHTLTLTAGTFARGPRQRLARPRSGEPAAQSAARFAAALAGSLSSCRDYNVCYNACKPASHFG